MKKIISVVLFVSILSTTATALAAFNATPEVNSTFQKALVDQTVQRTILNYFKKNKIVISKNDLLELTKSKVGTPTTTTSAIKTINQATSTPDLNTQSSPDRPIGTVEIFDTTDILTTNTVWEIVTTNDVVTGYQSEIDQRTNAIEKDFSYKIKQGSFDKDTGLLYVMHSYWRYPTIMEDLVIIDAKFKIDGTKVIDEKGNIIGKFTPNLLTFTKKNTIPTTQGCDLLWGDISKIYYDKSSKFFSKKTTSYNSDIKFFCSEQDAVKKGYTKSKI